MLRVLRRSFFEPLRRPGSAVALIGSTLLLWIVVAVFVIIGAEQSAFLPWLVGRITNVIQLAMFAPILILAFPLIASEAKDRTLLLNLMAPIDRGSYFAGRVLGRALFALVYFAVALGGVLLEISWFNQAAFGGGATPFPPDIAWTLGITGLSMTSVVLSLAALAPVASSRFAHLAYWLGLYVAVQQSRDVRDNPAFTGIPRALADFVAETVQPFLVGPDPAFVAEASLGGWYLQRVLLQWGFGAALALWVGVVAFSRMEVAKRV
jgi:hypothetical protein